MGVERAPESRTRTISVEADASYVFRLKALASLREQSVGSLVREALDLAVGRDMELLAAGNVPDTVNINRKRDGS